MTAEKTIIGKGIQGTVLSHKTDKTAIVVVERYVKHPKYGKFIVHKKKYKVHDENNEYAEGDVVKILPCRPVSKEKRFKITAKIR